MMTEDTAWQRPERLNPCTGVVFFDAMRAKIREDHTELRRATRTLGLPVLLNGTSHLAATAAPRVGEHSRSVLDEFGFGADDAVEDIAAVMRGLNIEKAHIVGLSMGAYATLCFGLRYPDKASALVVAGVGSGSPPADRPEFVAHSKAMASAFVELVRRFATSIVMRFNAEFEKLASWRFMLCQTESTNYFGTSGCFEEVE